MSQRTAILVAAILGSAIVFLDATIVNVALETIGRELPATFVGRLEGLTYVNSAYFAVLAALLILAGAISDYYGRRRTFRIGLIGFGAASVACGLAPTMEVLIGARILQGAFGAILVPGSLSIITAAFEGEERGRAIGLWAAGTSATSIIGPLLGGVLVQGLSWRLAFLINVPLVLLALWATTRVPESRDTESRGDFDWLGAAVIAIGVGGLAFGATRGQEQNWQDPIAWVALIVGFVAIVAVPILMLTRPRPLIPPGLFKSRNFTIVNISTFLIYGALYVSFAFQGLFFQGTLGYQPPRGRRRGPADRAAADVPVDAGGAAVGTHRPARLHDRRTAGRWPPGCCGWRGSRRIRRRGWRTSGIPRRSCRRSRRSSTSSCR